jgi:hypothetical protein
MGLTASPCHTTGHTGHVSRGSLDEVRVIHAPQPGRLLPACQWSVHSRRQTFRPTPRRMPSGHSTRDDESSLPFGPSHHGGGTMPSADFCEAFREDCSPLRPLRGHPADLSRSAVTPSVHRCRIRKVHPILDGGLRSVVPTRPEHTTPHIRLVPLSPHLCSTRPSDPISR